jgi:hypothetical protein
MLGCRDTVQLPCMQGLPFQMVQYYSKLFSVQLIGFSLYHDLTWAVRYHNARKLMRSTSFYGLCVMRWVPCFLPDQRINERIWRAPNAFGARRIARKSVAKLAILPRKTQNNDQWPFLKNLVRKNALF